MDPRIEEATRLLAEARRINDNPAKSSTDVARAHQLVKAADDLRRAVTLDSQIAAGENWLSEPQHKHDMVGLGGPLGVPGGGDDRDKSSQVGGLPKATKAFVGWLRDGVVPPEAKADLVENATGLTVIPVDFAGVILKELPRVGVIRGLAYVRPTTKASVDIGNVVINTAGWGRLETGTSNTDGLSGTPAAADTIEVQDLTALVKLGRDELEDSDEALASIVQQALVMKFAELEDDAFAGGSGTDEPWGIGTRATGGLITQAVTAAANATVVPDDLKKLPFAVPARFRRNGTFLAHSSAAQAIALLKDTEGQYLVQPNAAAGEPPTLFGYRYETCDGLPAMTTNATATDPSVMFGDFNAGYMIADRRQVTVQRLDERFAEEGKVGFLFSERCGGDVVRAKAFAAYKL